MDKNIAFWIIFAALVFAIFYGPVRHLWTGVVEFNNVYNSNGKRLVRSLDPVKFYLHVAFEFSYLALGFGVFYWAMFWSNIGAK